MALRWTFRDNYFLFTFLFFVSFLFIHMASAEKESNKPDKTIFSETKIRIGQKELSVEVADHPAAHAQGLMHRKSLDPNSGMLFVFAEERTLGFWMKNTRIPLSIAFIDAQKRIVDIQDMNPLPSGSTQEPSVYSSRKPAQFALEVNQGWFSKNRIKVGDVVKFKIGK